MALDELFQVLQKKLQLDDQFDNETESLITYLTVTVEAYLKRRHNIFAILGKNEEDTKLITNFNSEYFEQMPISEELDSATTALQSTNIYPHGLIATLNATQDSDIKIRYSNFEKQIPKSLMRKNQFQSEKTESLDPFVDDEPKVYESYIGCFLKKRSNLNVVEDNKSCSLNQRSSIASTDPNPFEQLHNGITKQLRLPLNNNHS